ncbi:hypothetical protein BpHYR1_025471, partial [Brachionus plicatilis]
DLGTSQHKPKALLALLQDDNARPTAHQRVQPTLAAARLHLLHTLGLEPSLNAAGHPPALPVPAIAHAHHLDPIAHAQINLAHVHSPTRLDAHKQPVGARRTRRPLSLHAHINASSLVRAHRPLFHGHCLRICVLADDLGHLVIAGHHGTLVRALIGQVGLVFGAAAYQQNARAALLVVDGAEVERRVAGVVGGV